MKRFVALLLAVLISVMIFPTAVSAEEDSSVAVSKVYITTQDNVGNTLKKEDGYVIATSIRVKDKNGTVTDKPGQIKVRGNTTAGAGKKPFTVKFDKKQNLLNMGSAKKWVLLSNPFDPTLLRNYVAFNFAKHMNIEYTSEQEYVEMYMDGEYKGCYTLMEPVEVKENRVEINLTEEADSDFMLEFESSREEEGVTYLTTNGSRFAVSEPEVPTEAQLAYIQTTMDSVTNAINSKDYDRIKEAIDVDSFVKFLLLNELYKTVDFNYSSVYYYFKDGKLHAGPPWDYDLSTGNIDPNVSESIASPEGLRASSNLIFKNLYKCDEFVAKFKQEYRENYDYITNIYSDNGMIDNLTTTYADLFAQNFQRWDISQMYLKGEGRTADPTFAENVDFFKNWLSQRNAWLASENNGLDVFRTQRLIDTEISPDAEDSQNIASFELPEDITFKSADLLGVQRKYGENSFRFISVVSSALLAQAKDYGYVFVTTDKSTSVAKENAGKVNLKNGHKFSCYGTSNILAGSYGDYDAQENYKYITAAINNVQTDKAVVARFYIETADGVHYAKYVNAHDGCAVRIAELPDRSTT